MSHLTGTYLSTVLVGLGIAFVEQAFLPRFVSRHTAWGLAPGWQREIAVWNIALSVVIGGVLWSKDQTAQRVVVYGVVVLAALLGTNHLVACLSNRNAVLHRVGAFVNYFAVGAGVIVLLA